jgi:hypothetical protein
VYPVLVRHENRTQDRQDKVFSLGTQPPKAR